MFTLFNLLDFQISYQTIVVILQSFIEKSHETHLFFILSQVIFIPAIKICALIYFSYLYCLYEIILVVNQGFLATSLVSIYSTDFKKF